ncbi:MAG: tRNA dihydrouridine synthase [Candidatus Kapaibacterium sp.]
MKNFWNDISKPVYSLAPMEDVTDTVFREIVLGISDPDYLHVLFAEFTSTDGLCHEVGREKVSHRLHVNESERKLLKEKGVKLVAQIWGSDPEKYSRSVKLICEEMDFDGIDINMGCPVRKIVKSGACSDLIRTPDLAKEIIQAATEAADIPVSVKTRTGINEHITEEWIGQLLDMKPPAITLHARTQKMMSDKPADWQQLGKAVRLRDQINPDTLIIGNGDIFSFDDSIRMIHEQGVDGIMIGRGIFKDPWIFNPDNPQPGPAERLGILLKQAELYEKTWRGIKNFNILKRFFKIYTSGFYNASDIRNELMQAKNAVEVREIISGTMYYNDKTTKEQ